MIAAAIGIEKQYNNGIRLAFTEYTAESKKCPAWMLTSYKIEPQADSSNVFTISLIANRIKLLQWMNTMPWLWNGVFAATLECGVSMMYSRPGTLHYEKIDFYLQDANSSRKLILPLLDKKIDFEVHRKRYSPNEWEIHVRL